MRNFRSGESSTLDALQRLPAKQSRASEAMLRCGRRRAAPWPVSACCLLAAATAASPVLVAHDARLCVTWEVAGGGLPPSAVTKCLDPFEAGADAAGPGHAGLLSPGVHTVSLSLQPGYGGGARVQLVSASFAPAYAGGAVAVPVFVESAPSDRPEYADVGVASVVHGTAATVCGAAPPDLAGVCAALEARATLEAAMLSAAFNGMRGGLLDLCAPRAPSIYIW